jgi:DNA-binding ferritin-like protein
VATRRVNDPKATSSRRPPAKTPKDRENQLVALAVDQAEKLMQEGNAPAQIITHYLKLGSSREQLEQERMAHEIELLKIKREQIESEARQEERMKAAMDAFRGYSTGRMPTEEEGYEG